MEQKRIPGTPLPFLGEQKNIALFRRMAEAAGGLSLSQVCALTGLEGSTVQNWVKRGWVAKPVNKKYGERQLARILIINALRNSLQLDQIAALLAYVNGSAEDESDDIIEEALLFDYFCACISNLYERESFSEEELERAVFETAQDYKGPYPEAVSKLRRALCVMCEAYLAASLRERAELRLREALGI